jgi:hypothetical protein
VKNLINGASNKTVIDVGRAGGIVEPGSRGLRGVLDNIVNDGMRMAAEMRKRMDEAQKEFERNAREQGQKPYRDDDDEEEEYDEKGTELGKRDQELLEGAEVASIRTYRSDEGTRSRAQSSTSGSGSGGSGASGSATGSATTTGEPSHSVSILDVDDLTK